MFALLDACPVLELVVVGVEDGVEVVVGVNGDVSDGVGVVGGLARPLLPAVDSLPRPWVLSFHVSDESDLLEPGDANSIGKIKSSVSYWVFGLLGVFVNGEVDT